MLSELENFGDMSSEFYLSINISYSNIIRKRDYLHIADFSYVTDGEHGSPDYDEKSRIRYITAEHIKPNYIQESEFRTISEKQHKLNKRASLQRNDVLIYSVGAYAGYAAVAEPHLFPCNIPRSVAIARPDYNKIVSEFLCVFLNTKYGSFQTKRFRAGNSQPVLALEKINQFEIPKLEMNFQLVVKSLYQKAYNYRLQSKALYTQAEKLLLQEIGLEGFTPSTDGVNIKTLSESFATTGRLDAEYYQKKYDDYIALITSYKAGYQPISEACRHKSENYAPEISTEYHYIELSNIGKTGDIQGCTTASGEELPSRARRKVATGDVIISSIEGSLDSCALVTKGYDGALCSTGFYVLRGIALNAETLLVLFKSPPMQALLKQQCSGTILTAINKEDFLNIPLPLIDNDIQKTIATMIKESFTLKARSESLLELAKRAVEVAIEQDEAVALHMIEEAGI